jgi:hypothetical protein
MPEKDNVCVVHDVIAVLWLHSVVHVMLFPTINVLYFTPLLDEVCVQCLTWLVSLSRAFPVCHSEIVGMISDGPVVLLLLQVSLRFYIPHTLYLYCKVPIFYILHTLYLYCKVPIF